MTKTTILYGVITLLLLLYIGYRLYQHKRNMEYFQQADSVYFQSTVDGDDSEQGRDERCQSLKVTDAVVPKKQIPKMTRHVRRRVK